MDTLLAFSLTLLVAVLLSSLTSRSVISASVLFLVVGIVGSPALLGFVGFKEGDPAVKWIAELTLFGVLFTDGMRVSVWNLRDAWRLPGRALVFGMPLTLVITAFMAKLLLGLTWSECFLVGAALSPTDPVFASALIGKRHVPKRLQHLLNVESGLNDGLALPVVMILLAVANTDQLHLGGLAAEVLGGVALGICIPLVALKLEQSRLFSASPNYLPLNAFAIGLVLLSVAYVLHANIYLAAFAGGVTMATVGPEARDAFHRFGELVTELMKLATLLFFGALISPPLLGDIHWYGYVWAVLVLLAVRPLALTVALLGSKMPWMERLAASWFGPKGFASVIYGLLILESGIENGEHLFHLIAIVVGASIIAHSSTDVLIARQFESDEQSTEEMPEESVQSERAEYQREA